jgi:hypothetical protein
VGQEVYKAWLANFRRFGLSKVNGERLTESSLSYQGSRISAHRAQRLRKLQ